MESPLLRVYVHRVVQRFSESGPPKIGSYLFSSADNGRLVSIQALLSQSLVFSPNDQNNGLW